MTTTATTPLPLLAHGEFVLRSGEQLDFDTFTQRLFDVIRPEGALELDLFTQLAHASWTLRRLRRLDAELEPADFNHFDRVQRAIGRTQRVYLHALSELKSLQSSRLLAAEAGLPASVANAPQLVKGLERLYRATQPNPTPAPTATINLADLEAALDDDDDDDDEIGVLDTLGKQPAAIDIV